MRDKHVQRIIFRQTHQRTIINSSKKSQMCHTNRVEMHINTDIGIMRQQRHHRVSDEKQRRNCSHATVSILAAWRGNPGIVIGASLELSDTRST